MSGSPLSSLRTAMRRWFGEPLEDAVPPTEAEDARYAVERKAIEQLMGTSVGHLALYEQALRHRSVLRGEPASHLASNERLEFLGDAVLGFVVAEVLYEQFPDRAEGYLTRLRAKLVNGRYLARCARRLGVGLHLLLSDNMDQADGRTNRTILADAFEALIGALYLDQGLPAAYQFIVRTMLEPVDLTHLAERQDNYKSLLLEYAQARGWPQPTYRVANEEGPSHAMTFTVEVVLHGEPYGRGRARSKKQAEQQAAEEALDRLDAEEDG